MQSTKIPFRQIYNDFPGQNKDAQKVENKEAYLSTKLIAIFTAKKDLGNQ